MAVKWCTLYIHSVYTLYSICHCIYIVYIIVYDVYANVYLCKCVCSAVNSSWLHTRCIRDMSVSSEEYCICILIILLDILLEILLYNHCCTHWAEEQLEQERQELEEEDQSPELSSFSLQDIRELKEAAERKTGLDRNNMGLRYPIWLCACHFDQFEYLLKRSKKMSTGQTISSLDRWQRRTRGPFFIILTWNIWLITLSNIFAISILTPWRFQ